MMNRLGIAAICVLLVLLFAALPMAIMAGRVVKARARHAITKTVPPR